MSAQVLEREAQLLALEHERERVEACELEALEREHQRVLQGKRQEHLQAQHSCEYNGQVAYSEKRKLELTKKHELERKARPKRLKVLTISSITVCLRLILICQNSTVQYRVQYSTLFVCLAAQAMELQVRKQMEDQVRLMRQTHKQQRTKSTIELSAAMSKNDVKLRLKQMDDECERRVRALQEQCEQNINEMLTRESVCTLTFILLASIFLALAYT